MFKFKVSWKRLKFRNPFGSPLNLRKIQSRLFSAKAKKEKLTWRRVGKYALWTTASFILIIVFLFAWYAKDLPTPGKIKNLSAAGSTQLFDRNGKRLYTISGEQKRIAIEEKDIPDSVRQATISLEDHNFYDHIGIDAKGLARAFIFGGNRGGGSTITQQLVRNAVLKDKKRTFSRKVREAILAIEMEALYSKEQILTMYLNQVPYGGNNYGIEAASRSFFAKSAKDLTLAEAATLASLPQQPSTLSPYGQHVDKLIARRDFALSEMTSLGYITNSQADEAKKIQMVFSAKKDAITAPHFVLYVKEWLVNYFTEQLNDRQAAEQKVEEGGLSVTTTLDLDKQLMAEEIVAKAKDATLKRAGASNAGLVTIDPKRGEVIAMVGSVDYFQEQFGAFNVTTAERQPGSSFKPVVYATAFKEKYNPGYTIFDLRTDFGKYTPDNYDGAFRGPITIRSALGNSLNIPAVKILGLVGIDKALKTAHDMGITTLNDKDRYGLSLVLGGGEVKLLDLTTAYGVFANKGVLMPTTPILKITDTKNKVIYDHTDPKDGQQVLDPQAAYEITSILSDVEAKKPTFSRTLGVLTLNGRPVASKTGTTDAFRDAWTMGYTPQYVTGVWAGNNDNTPMNRAGGSVAAAPIWDEMMERLHKDLPVEEFTRPDGIQEVTVDRLSNKLPGDGSDPIKDIFARWQVPTEKDDVHIQVRVCKENGLLADDTIPDSLAEMRTYTNIHSEMPKNPNWEGPVQAWAASQGLNNKPPTDKCSSANVSPSISITSPAPNQEVSGTINLSASASAPSGIASVEFLIDQVSVGTDTDSPYSISFNANTLANGDHIVGAVARSNNGSTANTQVTFIVNKDSTPPGEVTAYNCVPGPGAGKASLSWVNPTDTDFKLVRIYIYFFPSLAEARSPVEVNKPGISTVISSLLSGQYQFTAKTVDENGNESAGKSCVISVL